VGARRKKGGNLKVRVPVVIFTTRGKGIEKPGGVWGKKGGCKGGKGGGGKGKGNRGTLQIFGQEEDRRES